jgi:hypothetical protein
MTAPTSPERADQPLTDPVIERELAAFIGPRWSTYRKKFAPFLKEPGFVPTWNWPAALAPFGIWFLYRKMLGPFVLFWWGPGIAVYLIAGKDATSATREPDPLSLGIMISMALIAGGTGNYLLYRRAVAARQLVTSERLPEPKALERLALIGGVNRAAIWVGIMLMLLAGLIRMLLARAG